MICSYCNDLKNSENKEHVLSRKRENRWELRKTKNLNKDFGFVLAMQPICKQSIKAYVGLLSLSFYCWETCIWLSLALLLGIDMELILLYNYRPWNMLLHFWKEPCRSLQETNRTIQETNPTIHKTNHTVYKANSIVHKTNCTMQKACIDNLRKNTLKMTKEAYRTVQHTAKMTFVARWRGTEIIANHISSIFC